MGGLPYTGNVNQQLWMCGQNRFVIVDHSLHSSTTVTITSSSITYKRNRVVQIKVTTSVSGAIRHF